VAHTARSALRCIERPAVVTPISGAIIDQAAVSMAVNRL
jgi:hypothetical protein